MVQNPEIVEIVKLGIIQILEAAIKENPKNTLKSISLKPTNPSLK